MTANDGSTSGARPQVIVAELTHRCPLGCPYCFNPLALEPCDGELDVATWARVFGEAAMLGVRQADLSGGEPGARRDLVEIAASAREAGLYTNLVTSGVGISTRTMRDLWEAGLDRVSVSFQDADAVSADRIAGRKGAFQRKYALATEAVRLGLALTVHFVLHRANIERIGAMVELAMALRAGRIEIAPVQYLGWARRNRAALTPARTQIERAAMQVGELRQRGGVVIDTAAPDCCALASAPAGEPSSLNVTPSGTVLPCRDAGSISGLEFWNVRDHALEEIWTVSPAFKTFRDASGRAPCRGPVTDFDPAAQETPSDAAEPYCYRH